METGNVLGGVDIGDLSRIPMKFLRGLLYGLQQPFKVVVARLRVYILPHEVLELDELVMIELLWGFS